ncbi:TM2 domain-containing protein [Lachnoclostridium phytofermentans]|uniref:TM2 domain containing protein n=1 Tax=Lachnoclostridium phytofermentans (strain ATCC 700394 / DSM 18823 / ISDg) TaxID=357809 RepID=A9KRQ8_LACP7|nr:TM2 domain-containing protein [Lachnoclostridium phytofermentans]ABX43552.1 TM2 domain containing protein [Lachnoclostridium phytofermentans ISDg]
MDKCPNCGASLENNQCLYCGSSFREKQEQQALQNQAYQNQAYQNQAYQNQAYQNQAHQNQAYQNYSSQTQTSYNRMVQSQTSQRTIHISSDKIIVPRKKQWIALCLCLFTGIVGFHYLYLKRYNMFLLYFFTGGLLGFGYFIDLFRIIFGFMKDADDQYLV